MSCLSGYASLQNKWMCFTSEGRNAAFHSSNEMSYSLKWKLDI